MLIGVTVLLTCHIEVSDCVTDMPYWSDCVLLTCPVEVSDCVLQLLEFDVKLTDDVSQPVTKRWRDDRWKRWDGTFTLTKLPDVSAKELNEVCTPRVHSPVAPTTSSPVFFQVPPISVSLQSVSHSFPVSPCLYSPFSVFLCFQLSHLPPVSHPFCFPLSLFPMSFSPLSVSHCLFPPVCFSPFLCSPSLFLLSVSPFSAASLHFLLHSLFFCHVSSDGHWASVLKPPDHAF